MKKNHVWVIECRSAGGKWLPAYTSFYHTRASAKAEKPANGISQYIGKIEYRIRKYEAQ